MPIDNTNDEEAFLVQQLLDARHKLELHKNENTLRRLAQAKLEAELETIEQAVADYMQGNGLTQFEARSLEGGCVSVTLGESESIDVNDVAAVPEAFIRTKLVTEPNKVLIKELKPAGNWYVIKKSNKITVRSI